MSPSSAHIRRRIWQEALSILILTSPETKVGREQKMLFAEAPNAEWPPYLLGFRNTAGERHIENIKVRRIPRFSVALRDLHPIARSKILRETGAAACARGYSLRYGPDGHLFHHVWSQIEQRFIGPDSYWEGMGKPTSASRCRDHFGNAWLIPFPPTIVSQRRVVIK